MHLNGMLEVFKMNNQPNITTELAQELIAEQFPEYASLPIRSVKSQGHDNRTFRLGDKMLIRLPSAKEYAAKVPKEQQWLPYLASHLSLPIPKPLHLGEISQNYPWNWSIYNWIEEDSANNLTLNDQELDQLAIDLAKFLNELQKIDATNAPTPGAHNFYRGTSPKVYDEETRAAIKNLSSLIDQNRAILVWEKAISSEWRKPPVWIHGDLASDNILIKNKKLSAVIDFSGICVGDPACDLVIYWTFFKNNSKQIFRDNIGLDDDTWNRAKAWCLWKALITLAEIKDKNSKEAIIQTLLVEELLTKAI